MLYIVLPTCFSRMSVRLELTLKTINKIRESKYIGIIVDNSPQEIYNILDSSSSFDNIHLIKQTNLEKKGGAIRQGIQYILDIHQSDEDIILFHEPEKHDLVRFYTLFLQSISHNMVCVPYRTKLSLKTYPIEQQLLEEFTNKYITKLVNHQLDWTFGPILFSINLSKYWLECKEPLWGAQIYPLLRCIDDDVSIVRTIVNYRHDKLQTMEEENNIEFMDKRIMQLNYWDEGIKNYLKI